MEKTLEEIQQLNQKLYTIQTKLNSLIYMDGNTSFSETVSEDILTTIYNTSTLEKGDAGFYQDEIRLDVRLIHKILDEIIDTAFLDDFDGIDPMELLDQIQNKLPSGWVIDENFEIKYQLKDMVNEDHTTGEYAPIEDLMKLDGVERMDELGL